MLTLLLAGALLSQADIQLDSAPNGSKTIRVAGGRGRSIAVYVVSDRDSNLPALLGATSTLGNDALFTPRFPLESGRDYRVEVSGEPRISKVIRIPNVSLTASTIVQHIYPTSDRLPANQLKLYVEFSAPMSRGAAYEHIHLLDDTGKKIERPFLELGEELWDGRQTRFTLLFDPGRIKRDLVPNIDDGTPLQPGRRYTLKIDSTWLDSNGAPLKSEAIKRFEVTSADRFEPDPATWSIRVPARDSKNPLVIDFPEPMDHGLLQRTIRIVDRTGTEVAGNTTIENNERRLSFAPNSKWQGGEHQLVVEGSLEDLAGNRIGRLFEVDTRTAPEMANRASSETRLKFTVGNGGAQ